MKYDPNRPHRRTIRLKHYDYSQAGAYFVTICTRQRKCILHDPVIAGITLDIWDVLPKWFPTLALDEIVIMPNHVHFLVWLRPVAGAAPAAAPNIVASIANPSRTWVIPEPESINDHPILGDVIGAFKSLVLTVYLDWVAVHDPTRLAKFWQRNYYEHVIRDDPELSAVRLYIQNNPLQWELDRDNPIDHQPVADSAREYLTEAGLQ